MDASLTDSYAKGWTAMSRMIWSGSSWSGRERHCTYLNLGNGTFANVSAAEGLDFADDARALVVCDFDGDGDLDLWIKNRTGPQLRYLQNDAPGGNFVSVRLTGVTCNRDAVGATITLRAGGRILMQTVTAGSGFLAQSSKTLHFGLGDATAIDSADIRWPGGKTETIALPEVNRHYAYTQGGGRIVELPPRSPRVASSVPAGGEPPAAATRTILRQPFPLPPDVLGDPGEKSEHSATLINFWANWCSNCLIELTEFSKHRNAISESGINIVPLCLDHDAKDQAKARRVASRIDMPYPVRFLDDAQAALFASILRSTLDIHTAMDIPLSLLVDRDGFVQLIYTARVPVEQLIDDARQFCGSSARSERARAPFPGRWYSAATRSYADLVSDLKQAGRRDWARFYLNLDRARRNR